MKELIINKLIVTRGKFIRNNYYEAIKFNDNKKIEKYVNNIDFINYLPEKFNNMCSIYKTFFDGNKFYYDYEFKKLNDDKKVTIILNEIFNFIQGYYIYYDKITKKQILNIQNKTLLCMYHIGIINEKVNYALKDRKNLIFTFNKEKVEILEPNRLASKYLLDLILNKDNYNYNIGSKILKFESVIIKNFEIYTYELEIKKTGLNFDNMRCVRRIFIDKETNKIVARNNKKVKEHINLIELINKFKD